MMEKGKWYEGVYYDKKEEMTLACAGRQFRGNAKYVCMRVEEHFGKRMNVKEKKTAIDELLEQGQLDEVDIAIVCRITTSVYLTLKQLEDYLCLMGLWERKVEKKRFFQVELLADESETLLQQRLQKLYKLRLVSRVYLRKLWLRRTKEMEIYKLGELGETLAEQSGVKIHKGNRYVEVGNIDKNGYLGTASQVLRMLEANHIMLQLLQGKVEVESFYFMNTLSLCENAKYNRCITRSALTVFLKNDEVFLFEIFRRHAERNEEYEELIRDKVRRYLKLMRRRFFLEKNNMQMKRYPVLVICGEDPVHISLIKEIIEPVLAEEGYEKLQGRAKLVFVDDFGVDLGALERVPFKESEQFVD